MLCILFGVYDFEHFWAVFLDARGCLNIAIGDLLSQMKGEKTGPQNLDRQSASA